MVKQQNMFFHQYFREWVDLYKIGAVREITLKKYNITHKYLKELTPNLRMREVDRKSYQKILNQYAQTHERQTVMDFHHQLKGALLDAMDEGIIAKNPTRKIVIKGKTPSIKKTKFLSQFELQLLMKQLELNGEANYDWLIFLIAKTGLRFSEAIALTPDDFDFHSQTIHINKTWNYRTASGGFENTKNPSSKRTILMDWQTSMKLAGIVHSVQSDELIFIKKRIFNSTINDRLAKYCAKAEIPIITIHGLRHTHASLLLYAGVSIASVARRLGHSNMTTTQKTYLHIIQELENQDNEKIMRHLSTLI